MELVTCFNRAEWREWLEAHHRNVRQAWLVYFKPGASQSGVDYESSVEEALCFGWIDSLIRKIDEQRYARLFTPRRPGSRWSESNVHRVRRLLAEGRMAQAGLEAIRDMPQEGYARAPAPPVPPDLAQALQEHPAAREAFEKLPASQRRNYLLWISAARRPKTLSRRIADAIDNLENGRPLGMK